MSTNIQVRSVEEGLAAAAKERAWATNRTLSDYVKDLIVRDVEAHDDAAHWQHLLSEIAADPDRPAVDRRETTSALRQVRQELGVELGNQ